MNDEAINDIGNALMTLRDAFDKHDIPFPTLMGYEGEREAWRARQMLFSIAANGPPGSWFRLVGPNSHDQIQMPAGVIITFHTSNGS